MDVGELPKPDELALNVVRSEQRKQKASPKSFQEKSSGEMEAGEITPCHTGDGKQTWKIRCPKCRNISWLDNWIDDGCDWCHFDPDKFVLKGDAE